MWALGTACEEEVDRESNCSNHHHASGRSQLCISLGPSNRSVLLGIRRFPREPNHPAIPRCGRADPGQGAGTIRDSDRASVTLCDEIAILRSMGRLLT